MKKTQNIVKYENIGGVKYVYNRKAKNYTIRINRNGDVRVTIPRYGNQEQAESFVLNRSNWITSKLRKIAVNKSEKRVYNAGDIITVRNREFILPSTKDGEDPEKILWGFLLKEANSYLPGRVDLLSRQHNLPYRGLKIRKMISRWGSCSPGNTINLNSWLIMLPDQLIDYVILHELVHTRYKNHSREFWVLLDRYCNGKAIEYRKLLRKQKIGHW